MDRREEESSELCVVCGEEVDQLDPSTHARIQGRTICRLCAHRLGGVYDTDRDLWSRQPSVPEALRARKD